MNYDWKNNSLSSNIKRTNKKTVVFSSLINYWVIFGEFKNRIGHYLEFISKHKIKDNSNWMEFSWNLVQYAFYNSNQKKILIFAWTLIFMTICKAFQFTYNFHLNLVLRNKTSQFENSLRVNFTCHFKQNKKSIVIPFLPNKKYC